MIGATTPLEKSVILASSFIPRYSQWSAKTHRQPHNFAEDEIPSDETPSHQSKRKIKEAMRLL